MFSCWQVMTAELTSSAALDVLNSSPLRVGLGLDCRCHMSVCLAGAPAVDAAPRGPILGEAGAAAASAVGGESAAASDLAWVAPIAGVLSPVASKLW